MLELLVPHEHELSSALCPSASVFAKLIDISCKKVYVLGNHDASLFERSCEINNSSNQSFETFLNWVCANNFGVEVVPRHYPKLPERLTRTAHPSRKKDYLFLHGQQFDRDLKTTGGLVRFVSFMGALASAFDFKSWIRPRFFIMSLVFLALFVAGALFISLSIYPLWFLVLFVLTAYPWVFLVCRSAFRACLGSQASVECRHRPFREVKGRSLN